MAIRTPPSWLQAGSHPAENDRLGTESLIGQQGVRLAGDLACTASGFNVVVAAGWAYVDGTVSATQGMYQTYNDGAVTLPISTAHPTLARIDRVVVTINDSFYGSASDSAVITLLAGTPSASPVAPTIPANSLSLATVAVAAAAISITNANITDTRTRAAALDYTFKASAVGRNPLIIQDNTGATVLTVSETGLSDLTVTQSTQATKGLVVKSASFITATVTSASYSAGTYTFTATNTFVAGNIVTITGCIPQNFNLSKVTIATATASSFTVTLTQESGSPTSTTTGGTATRQNASLLELQNSAGTAVASFDQNGILSTAGTLIASATFTSANSVNFKNVFSSSYSWYRVVGWFTNFTAGTILFRFASGATLYSAAEYSASTIQNAAGASGVGTAVSGSNINNTGIQAGTNGNNGWVTSEVDIYFPEAARQTLFNVRSFGANTAYTSLGTANHVQGFHQQAVAMDTLNVFHASVVSITGVINIYGMR